MISKGKFYADTLKYPHRNFLPIVEEGWTQETEDPYRKSAFCLVLRFPFTRPGLVLGIWGKPVNDEETALAQAMDARELSDTEWDDIFAMAYHKE